MAITEWRGISGRCRGGRRMDIGSFASVGAACAAGRYGRERPGIVCGQLSALRAGGGRLAALCGSLDDAMAAVAWATEDEG
jgi:hypothetical protein